MRLYEIENLSDTPSDLLGVEIEHDEIVEYAAETLTPIQEILQCLDYS
jgi:hypothetical protein